MKGINQLHESKKQWFAVYTKYKGEKCVTSNLSKKGIECYIPLIKKRKRYPSKTKIYQIPLISCYVFVYINKEEYLRVLETEYVYEFVKQGSDLIAVPEEEILILKRIVGETECEVNVVTEHLKLGDKIEIISGHLTGLKGFLIEKYNNSNFLIELRHLGVQLRMTVNRSYLRALETA